MLLIPLQHPEDASGGDRSVLPRIHAAGLCSLLWLLNLARFMIERVFVGVNVKPYSFTEPGNCDHTIAAQAAGFHRASVW